MYAFERTGSSGCKPRTWSQRVTTPMGHSKDGIEMFQMMKNFMFGFVCLYVWVRTNCTRWMEFYFQQSNASMNTLYNFFRHHQFISSEIKWDLNNRPLRALAMYMRVFSMIAKRSGLSVAHLMFQTSLPDCQPIRLRQYIPEVSCENCDLQIFAWIIPKSFQFNENLSLYDKKNPKAISLKFPI